MRQVSYNELTELTGITYRTIKDKFARAGVQPMGKEGRKHLFDSTVALRCLFGGGPAETVDDEEANFTQLLEREKYREKKRQNDLEESLVAPVSLLTEALEKAAAQIIPIMDGLPLEMKRRNPKLTGHDIQLVKKSIAKCRNAIADVEIEV